MQKQLIVIAGPTAIGKTSLSIRLAKHYSTEVISCDSRQFYREMQIGTARPTLEEMDGVPHHFVGHLSVEQDYNVSNFEQEVLQKLEELFLYQDKVVMVGGSGLYIKAVCEGIDELPDPHPDLRKTLQETFEQQGLLPLQERLQKLDPEYYAVVDQQNSKRLMRAIEVCETSGQKYSDLRKQEPKARPFDIVKIALNMEREELFDRISLRNDIMINEGLLDEVKSLLGKRHLNALNTVGYKEIFRYLDGAISLDQAITDIKTNTRRYAKRQLTWFKKDAQFHWFHPADWDEILNLIVTK